MKNLHNHIISRRRFLRGSVAGAATFGLAPTLFIPHFRPPFASDGWQNNHPNIDGLRVVEAHDDTMTTETLATAPWKRQEDLVNVKTVAENLDNLACALTDEKNPKDAWKAIFVKPPKKSWKSTVVAIKTNNIARQHTRSAVMAKICRVLVKMIGVKPTNLFIYDACHGADMLKKTPFKDLPAGCQVVGKWGGMKAEVEVPAPWSNNEGKTLCLGSLARGKVDILVNLALCKGHSPSFGSFTMTMKNHLGTFFPKWAHKKGGTEYLLAINKTPEVLGEISPKGKLLFPRQQLCIIDSLWASLQGPGCESSDQPNRLFMGTCSPVIDYVVAHEFRVKTMGWPVARKVTSRFLTEFGLTEDDLPSEEARLINALEDKGV